MASQQNSQNISAFCMGLHTKLNFSETAVRKSASVLLFIIFSALGSGVPIFYVTNNF